MPEIVSGVPVTTALLSDAATGLYLDTFVDPTTLHSRLRVRDAGGATYHFVLGADGTGPGGTGRALSLVAD